MITGDSLTTSKGVLRNGSLSHHKRVAVERCNSRLKGTRRLSKHQFRGFERIGVHATLAVLAMMAVALTKAKQGQPEEVRVFARNVG